MKKNFFPLIATALGFGIMLYSIFAGADGDMEKFGAFIDVNSFLIVIVGSLAATAIIYPLSDLKKLPKLWGAMLAEPAVKLEELPPLFESISQQARKDGILSLEAKLEEIDDEFIRRGIQMVVDGSEAEELRQILETELGALEFRHGQHQAMVGKWAELAPAFGMIGTVLGLILMLGDLGGDASELGQGMAVALITTLYGSAFQNLIFAPLADNLKLKTANEVFIREVMIEGIIMIQNGTNPRSVYDKLATYLSPAQRAALSETTGKEE